MQDETVSTPPAIFTLRRGDVVWVNLQGAQGCEKHGLRLCLIVSNERLNTRAPFIVILPITDIRSWRGIDEQVRIPADEMGPGGKDSVASTAELRQIDKNRINVQKGVMAHLPPDRMLQVDLALRMALAL